MNVILTLAVFLTLFLSQKSYAENGVSPGEIVFGQTAALAGPAAKLGIDMRHGIRAAFEQINRAGGVQGRLLKLISLNDGYEPGLAVENTKKLLHEEKVFALIGAVGTPSADARKH